MLIFNVICALGFHVIYMLAVSEHIKHYANVSISNFALYCVKLFLDHYYSHTIVLNCINSLLVVCPMLRYIVYLYLILLFYTVSYLVI